LHNCLYEIVSYSMACIKIEIWVSIYNRDENSRCLIAYIGIVKLYIFTNDVKFHIACRAVIYKLQKPDLTQWLLSGVRAYIAGVQDVYSGWLCSWSWQSFRSPSSFGTCEPNSSLWSLVHCQLLTWYIPCVD